MAQRFRIRGQIEESETGRALSALIVRAFDKDLLVDDPLGYATTDAAGHFEIRYSDTAFRDMREASPDLYLRIYDPSGSFMLHETSDAVRWNASPDECYRISISGTRLEQGAKSG